MLEIGVEVSVFEEVCDFIQLKLEIVPDKVSATGAFLKTILATDVT